MITELKQTIKENIENQNFEISNDEIICPYCGFKEDVEYEMYFGENDINPFEEGEQEVKCPNCNRIFHLSKELYWRYETSVIEKG